MTQAYCMALREVSWTSESCLVYLQHGEEMSHMHHLITCSADELLSSPVLHKHCARKHLKSKGQAHHRCPQISFCQENKLQSRGFT